MKTSYANTVIESIKQKKQTKTLNFFHIPKCAGSYVNKIVRDLGIETMEHRRPTGNEDKITFTVIRHPIERYESWLNYILNEDKPRNEWPKNLNYIYENKSKQSLNDVLKLMTDKDILGFKNGYGNLTNWINIDIFIKVEQLHWFLSYFGYDYNINDYQKINVSKKLRGTLDESSKNRLTRLFKQDIDMYNKKLLIDDIKSVIL